MRISDPVDSQFPLASSAVAHLHAQRATLIVAPQSIYEYWSVATRPAKQNGLALTPADVADNIASFKMSLTFVADPAGLYIEWLRLVTAFSVKGKESHDTRLVAFMNLTGIDQILTFNGPDFERYPSISAIHPNSVATTPL